MEELAIDGRSVSVHFRRNLSARRYRLFVDRDGQPRVTIPRRGTIKEAREFVHRHASWLRGQLQRGREQAEQRRVWTVGREIFLRGEPTLLEQRHTGDGTALVLGTETIPLPGPAPIPPEQLRPVIESHLRRIANDELPARTASMAARHGLPAPRVTIRNQKTRWGSCSVRRTVSLNWRLIQVPPDACDYVIVHELMHLKELNHSNRFWTLVRDACPDFAIHEAWLRKHERLIL